MYDITPVDGPEEYDASVAVRAGKALASRSRRTGGGWLGKAGTSGIAASRTSPGAGAGSFSRNVDANTRS
ncbi:MAG: hypothetical protein WBG15_01265, partial [Xanthobacteraceae bacterium]